MMDTEAMAERYGSDGFLVVPDLLSADEVAALNAEAAAICRGERGRVRGLAEDGVDGLEDDAVIARYLAIHFPHKISDLIARTLAYPRLIELLTALIGPDIKAMQSMLFVKAAGKPGQPWHQDEHFIATRDRSLLGAWIALDDATVENGCLWVHPGSHRAGVLHPMAPCDDPRFDHNDEAHGFPYEREGGVAVEVPAGGVVIFNGYLLHRSLPNGSTGFRRALVNHYMSARSLLPWAFAGTAREDWRDIVMVAGEDPYAWKGTETLIRPFVRAESREELESRRTTKKRETAQ